MSPTAGPARTSFVTRVPLLWALTASCVPAARPAPAAAAPDPTPRPAQAQGPSTSVSRAEALARAGQWPDAARAWSDVTNANPTNGRYWRLLAEARIHVGDVEGAAGAYDRAVDLGEAPADAAYAIATLRARQPDRDATLHALQRAFDLGFRDLERVRSDEAFASVRGDARFLALAGLPPSAPASREVGWRFDLDLLAREVHRRGYDPFRLVSSSQFDAEVKDLEQRVAKISDGEVIVEMAKLLRQIGDGHTGLLGVRRPEYAWALPLQLFLYDDGLRVTAADPKWRDLLGAKIVRMGGHPVADVMAALDPLLQRDNAMWPRAMAPYRLRSTALLHALGLVPEAERATLAIVDASGNQREVTVDADRSHPDIWNMLPYPEGWVGVADALAHPLPWHLRDNGAAHWLEYAEGPHLLYIQYNRVADDPQESLEAFASRVAGELASHDVRKLVLDLRQNNGGNTFLNEPLLLALLRAKGLDDRGRFFVLIGRRTFSAGLNVAAYLERHLHPIFVGEPTGGKPNSVGDEVPFTLPYSSAIVNVGDSYWESSWPQDRRSWIAPEIFVPPAFEAYRSGRDPAMDAVRSFVP
jgi:tetratricopeptide (TPR) repeat protein